MRLLLYPVIDIPPAATGPVTHRLTVPWLREAPFTGVDSSSLAAAINLAGGTAVRFVGENVLVSVEAVGSLETPEYSITDDDTEDTLVFSVPPFVSDVGDSEVEPPPPPPPPPPVPAPAVTTSAVGPLLAGVLVGWALRPTTTDGDQQS